MQQQRWFRLFGQPNPILKWILPMANVAFALKAMYGCGVVLCSCASPVQGITMPDSSLEAT